MTHIGKPPPLTVVEIRSAASHAPEGRSGSRLIRWLPSNARTMNRPDDVIGRQNGKVLRDRHISAGKETQLLRQNTPSAD